VWSANRIYPKLTKIVMNLRLMVYLLLIVLSLISVLV